MTATHTPHPFLPSGSGEAIIDAALALVGNGPVQALTVEQAALEAGISTSSVYHHFANRQGLIAAVEKERYRRLALAEDRGHLDEGARSTTPEEFLQFISEQLIRIVSEPDAIRVRRQRFRVAAAALDDDDVYARMAFIQAEMFSVIGELIADGQRRDLVNPQIDPIAYCAWFHGMTLGRTATERSFPDIEAWLAVALPAALAPLRMS
jgi:AcrR family transcriptional regulator